MDILIFSETYTHQNDIIKLDGFDILFRFDKTVEQRIDNQITTNNISGLIAFINKRIKNHINYTFVQSQICEYKNSNANLVVIKINNYNLLQLVINHLE